MSTENRSAGHRSSKRRWLFRFILAALIGGAVVARQTAFARNRGRSPLNVPPSPSARDVVPTDSP